MGKTYIARSEDLNWDHTVAGEGFESYRKALGSVAGAEKIGCTLYRVPSGKCSWPRHAHYVNEESIYILSGEGVARIGEDSHGVSAGDYIVYPPGDGTAHQLQAVGGSDLVYLCFSTMEEPDVIRYPDSKKIGVMVGAAPGGDQSKSDISAFFEEGSDVPYWKGET